MQQSNNNTSVSCNTKYIKLKLKTSLKIYNNEIKELLSKCTTINVISTVSSSNNDNDDGYDSNSEYGMASMSIEDYIRNKNSTSTITTTASTSIMEDIIDDDNEAGGSSKEGHDNETYKSSSDDEQKEDGELSKKSKDEEVEELLNEYEDNKNIDSSREHSNNNNHDIKTITKEAADDDTNEQRSKSKNKNKKQNNKKNNDITKKKLGKNVPCMQLLLLFNDVSIVKKIVPCQDIEIEDSTTNKIECMIEMELPYCLVLPRKIKKHIFLSTIKNNNDTILKTKYLNPILNPRNNTNKGHKGNQTLVLLIRNGYFAGGIFQQNKCIIHSTSQRYTIRKGQGKSQSSYDNQGSGKANSIGAQLRRQGEVKLREDIQTTLHNWTNHIRDNVTLILISCPKTQCNTDLFSDSNAHVLCKNDDRIRNIPLSIGRPTYSLVCSVYELLTSISIQSIDQYPNNHTTTTNTSTIMKNVMTDVTTTKESEIESSSKPKKIELIDNHTTPLTDLHIAAKDGDITKLQQILQSNHDNNTTTTTTNIIDTTCGEKNMTPLHYAAQSTSTTSPSIIQILLIQYHANPCIVDLHDRVPYYLCTNTSNRNAFRIARYKLGEDLWSWTDKAKVDEPLSEEMIDEKKKKAAEKKKRQKLRQKEKKQKEKIDADAEAKQQEQKKQEEALNGTKKQTRKISNKLACDFCNKICVRKSQMFFRLDYKYCSTTCVKSHQRQLMADAAMLRFQS